MSYNHGTQNVCAGDQKYVIDRKLLTIHSEDRDITKWSNSNNFEILVPTPLHNVQSMRLIQSSFPTQMYLFSEYNQNTKFTITTLGIKYTITIRDGNYTKETIVAEIMYLLNNAGISGAIFNVFFNNPQSRLCIGCNLQFTINADEAILYNNCPDHIVFKNYTNWGLPYNLGFDKNAYISAVLTSDFTLYDLTYNSIYDVSNGQIDYYVKAPFQLNLVGDTCIYMEVDKYNSYDELYPYGKSNPDKNNNPGGNNSTFTQANNAYLGKTESAFAKIPIDRKNEYIYDSRTLNLCNIVHYDPPLERVTRMRFKFRYHDGRLVDFTNMPFDFTIEFNMLRNEFSKNLCVRIPSTYLI